MKKISSMQLAQLDSTLETYLLSMLCILLFIVHCLNIYYPSIVDCDTGRILMLAARKDISAIRNFSDNAHPLLGALYIYICSLFYYPKAVYSVLLFIALSASMICLYYVLKRIGVSRNMGLLLLCAYLSVPVMHDLSTRAEENLIYHWIFTLTLYFIWKTFTLSSCVRYYILTTFMLMILAAQHVQPFIICLATCAALFIQNHFKSYRGGRLSLDELAGSAMCLLIPALFYIALVLKVGWSGYETRFQSIVSGIDIGYVGEILSNAQQRLVTGVYAHGIAGNCLLCFFGLCICLLIIYYYYLTPNTFSLAAVISLLFVSSYTPTDPERWDTVIIAFLLTIAFASSSRHRLKLIRKLLFMFVLICIPQSIISLHHINQTRPFMDTIKQTIGSKKSVQFCSLDAYREYIVYMPKGISMSVGDRCAPQIDIIVCHDLSKLENFLCDRRRLEQTALADFYVVSDIR